MKIQSMRFTGKRVIGVIILACSLVAQVAFADGGGIGAMAAKITGNFGEVAKFVTASFYLLGLGFFGSAIFKFKAHKDNPTQIPVGTPIALTFIGAAFLFAPSLFKAAGDTVFSDATAAGVSGTASFEDN